MTGVPGYARGASLKMWRDYFPNAAIHGVDIRPDALFEDDRIATHLCDQSRRDDLDALLRRIEGQFDIVIDDGSHETEHQLTSAAALLPHVKAGGTYIIEDATEPERLVNELAAMGHEATAHHFHQTWDDTVIVVRRGLAPLE
jgi:cephalosporin hydroxylase